MKPPLLLLLWPEGLSPMGELGVEGPERDLLLLRRDSERISEPAREPVRKGLYSGFC